MQIEKDLTLVIDIAPLPEIRVDILFMELIHSYMVLKIRSSSEMLGSENGVP